MAQSSRAHPLLAKSDYRLIAAREAYAEHRRMLRFAGYDPDFIGAHEVKSVCCEGCGKPIPWRTLRGWQD